MEQKEAVLNTASFSRFSENFKLLKFFMSYEHELVYKLKDVKHRFDLRLSCLFVNNSAVVCFGIHNDNGVVDALGSKLYGAECLGYPF